MSKPLPRTELSDDERIVQSSCQPAGLERAASGAAATGERLPRPERETSTGDGGHRRAVSITCPACFSKEGLEGVRYLAAGIDTLDVGFFIQWPESTWEQLTTQFEAAKSAAAGTPGVMWPDGEFLVMAGGKPPRYRWHLNWPEFHLFLAQSAEPRGSTPNGYAKLLSQSLWEHSPPEAVRRAIAAIEKLGGKVWGVLPSRVDLAADFVIPGGLSHEFLMEHRIPKNRKHANEGNGRQLETFYHGSRRSPVFLRIYDKGAELGAKQAKFWFLKIWGLETPTDIWRVEFQLRRPVLKQFQVDSIDQLLSKCGGIWEYLTTKWCSFRCPDNPNATRQTVHPWWVQVQDVATRFSGELGVKRNFEQAVGTAEWYVSHIAGCLSSYAARCKLVTFEETIDHLIPKLKKYYGRKAWHEQLRLKAIRMGYRPKGPKP